MNSIKFGIYKRRDKEKRSKNTRSNERYTWLPRYNNIDDDEDIAFTNVIKEVQQVANLAAVGDFKSIEYFGLPSIFKWKVAFLYSSNRLIPIFSKTNLTLIVKGMGMVTSRKTGYYDMQEFLMERKPLYETVVEYMRRLYTEHRIKIDKQLNERHQSKRRKPTTNKNKLPQKRNGHGAYIAKQFHNEIQEALYRKLCRKHGLENVHMELNWVDIMVILPERIILYEVKSDRWASDCILNGLGQVLGYAYEASKLYDKKLKLVIAGANELTQSEREFFTFIADQVRMTIKYLKINYTPKIG
jgi:hypothetical protein